MTGNVVLDAYAGRAEEYMALLGSMAHTHESDQRFVAQWARDLRGAVIDAGCGPGYSTDFLKKRGVDVEGIDQVQAFIGRARIGFPTVPFRVASLCDLGVRDGYAAAILEWYSVIHVAPNDLPAILREFTRCIAPGGSLLLGFFEAAGLHVHAVNTRTDPGKRSHAAIIAHRFDGLVPSEVPC